MTEQPTPSSPDRPNIVFILTDDQGCWAMRCAGNAELETPHLDRLAAGGTRFDHLFCASPVCSPARASILTGRIPSRHGIHDWLAAGNCTEEPAYGGTPIEYLKGQPGFTDVLAAQGYTCGLSGKWHMGDAHHPQKGFTFWEAHAKGGGPYYRAPMIRNGEIYVESRYVTDAITDHALSFLDGAAGRREPFYLSVHYTAPHSPWDRNNHPHDLYDAYFNGCPFASVPDEPHHPRQVRGLIQPDKSNRRAILSGYFAAVTAMDRGVGRILDRLDSLGLSRNTLVIFTGDNGMNMGHHGIYGKGNGTFPMNMYDTSVKVPFLARWPGRTPAGAVCSDLLSHYDLFPTILDAAGLPNPCAGALPGRSFAERLRGRPLPARDAVVVFDEYGPVRMIRTPQWKYVHRYPYGPHELHDLAGDPGETANRIQDPACQAVRRDLKGQLDEWFIRHADPALDGSREPVTGRGQIGLAGQAGRGAPAFLEPPPLLHP